MKTVHGMGISGKGENTLNLSFGFGIDLADIGGKSRQNICISLSDTEKTISAGQTRRKGALHLAMGDNIRTAPSRASSRSTARLEFDLMAKCTLPRRHNIIAEMAISFLNRRSRIDIGRRSPFSSNGGKINTIDGQYTVLIGKPDMIASGCG